MPKRRVATRCARAQRLDDGKPAQPDQVAAYGIILNRLGRSKEAIERLSAASRELHESGSEARALQADYQLARALMMTGKYEESQKLLGKVHRAWSENPTANKDRLGDLARTRAEIELANRRVSEAAELIDASLALFGYPSTNNALGLTAALTAASRIYLAKGQLPQAETFARDALRIAAGIARDPRQSADVGEAALVLAALHQTKGDRAAARDERRPGARSPWERAGSRAPPHPRGRSPAGCPAPVKNLRCVSGSAGGLPFMPIPPFSLTPFSNRRIFMRSSSFIVAALAIAAPFAAMATNINPPKVPDTLAVPAGSKAFLIGHAVGTQNYICLPDGAGAKWVLFGPQATVFDDHGDN